MQYRLSRRSTRIAAKITREATRPRTMFASSSFENARQRVLEALDGTKRINLATPVAEDLRLIVREGQHHPARRESVEELALNLEGRHTIEQGASAALLYGLVVVAIASAGFIMMAVGKTTTTENVGLALIVVSGALIPPMMTILGPLLRLRYPASAWGLRGERRVEHRMRFDGGLVNGLTTRNEMAPSGGER